MSRYFVFYIAGNKLFYRIVGYKHTAETTCTNFRKKGYLDAEFLTRAKFVERFNDTQLELEEILQDL